MAINGRHTVPCRWSLLGAWSFGSLASWPYLAAGMHFLWLGEQQDALSSVSFESQLSQGRWAPASPRRRVRRLLLAALVTTVALCAILLAGDDRAADDACGCMPLPEDVRITAPLSVAFLIVGVWVASRLRSQSNYGGLRVELILTAGIALVCSGVFYAIDMGVPDRDSYTAFFALQVALALCILVHGLWPALRTYRIFQAGRRGVRARAALRYSLSIRLGCLECVAGRNGRVVDVAGALVSESSQSSGHRRPPRPVRINVASASSSANAQQSSPPLAQSLGEVLRDRSLYAAFRQHLRREYTLENLAFYEAAQRFQAEAAEGASLYGDPETATLPAAAPAQEPAIRPVSPVSTGSKSRVSTSSELGGSHSPLAVRARRIANDFLRPGAPFEVNLPAGVRARTLAAACLSSSTNHNPALFAEAAAEIYRLMERDSFQRFRRAQASGAASPASPVSPGIALPGSAITAPVSEDPSPAGTPARRGSLEY